MPCEIAQLEEWLQHAADGLWLQYSHASACFCVTIPVLHNPSAVGEEPTEHIIYFTKREKLRMQEIDSKKQTAVLGFKKREAPGLQEISTFRLGLTKIAENFDIVDPPVIEHEAQTGTRHIHVGGFIEPIAALCLEDDENERNRQYHSITLPVQVRQVSRTSFQFVAQEPPMIFQAKFDVSILNACLFRPAHAHDSHLLQNAASKEAINDQFKHVKDITKEFVQKFEKELSKTSDSLAATVTSINMASLGRHQEELRKHKREIDKLQLDKSTLRIQLQQEKSKNTAPTEPDKAILWHINQRDRHQFFISDIEHQMRRNVAAGAAPDADGAAAPGANPVKIEAGEEAGASLHVTNEEESRKQKHQIEDLQRENSTLRQQLEQERSKNNAPRDATKAIVWHLEQMHRHQRLKSEIQRLLARYDAAAAASAADAADAAVRQYEANPVKIEPDTEDGASSQVKMEAGNEAGASQQAAKRFKSN